MLRNNFKVRIPRILEQQVATDMLFVRCSGRHEVYVNRHENSSAYYVLCLHGRHQS